MEIKDTKTLLSQSLMSLLQTKKLDQIRVYEICQECGLSKKAFYYYFQDKYDLATYMTNEIESENIKDFLYTDSIFEDISMSNPWLLHVVEESEELLSKRVQLWLKQYPPTIGYHMFIHCHDINNPNNYRHEYECIRRKKLLENIYQKLHPQTNDKFIDLAVTSLTSIANYYYSRWNYQNDYKLLLLSWLISTPQVVGKCPRVNSIHWILFTYYISSISISLFACNFIYNWINNFALIKNIQNCLIHVIIFYISYMLYKFLKDGILAK